LSVDCQRTTDIANALKTYIQFIVGAAAGSFDQTGTHDVLDGKWNDDVLRVALLRQCYHTAMAQASAGESESAT